VWIDVSELAPNREHVSQHASADLPPDGHPNPHRQYNSIGVYYLSFPP
jgi:hypothetical protein